MSKIYFVEKRGNLFAYGMKEKDRLVELFFVREEESHLGHIFRGRVLDSGESSDYLMVEIGLSHPGILRKKDMLELRKPGDTVLVQITRDSYDEKGPKLSEFLRLGGKYLLLTPYKRHLIFPLNTELFLKKSRYYEICREQVGYRLRSAGAKVSEQILQREYDALFEEWEKLGREKNFLPIPKLLKREEDAILKYFRDFSNRSEITQTIVNDHSVFEHFKYSFDDEMNFVFDEDWSIFRDPVISKGMKELQSRTVHVSSGANLVFDKTEAMNIIDVNSASFSKAGIRTSMGFQVNQSVLQELVRQIRLRDLGGIIIVDFIEMDDAERRALKEDLVDLLANDSRTTVYDFTRLGLLEMTRKRYGRSSIGMDEFILKIQE